MIEDAELLRRYARFRSEPDFAELVRRRIGLVYAVALQRTRDAHLAEDAAQAVFSDLARKAAAMSGHAVLGTVFAQQAMAAAPAGLAAGVTSGALVASAAVSPALAFLQFMTTAKTVAGVAGAALTIAVLGTAYETKARRSAEASLAAAQMERSGLGERLHALEQRARAAERDAALLKEKADPAARAAEMAKASLPKANRAWDPLAEGEAYLARHPALKQAVAEMADANTRFPFGGAYRPLELSPDQITRFEALMREGFATGMPLDGQMAMLSAGTGVPVDTLPERMLALLGKEKSEKLWEYARKAPDRELAGTVAGALCFTNTPLTTAQSDQLVKVISGSRPRGSTAGPDWEQVVAKARAFLSPPQLAILESARPQAAEQALVQTTPRK